MLILGKNIFEKIKSSLKNKNWLVFIPILVFFVINIIISYKLFLVNQFTSDGYINYSALHNTLKGYFFYEGPTFGSLLASHSYLILIFFIPLVVIFNTPYLLLVISNILIALAAILLVRILRLKNFRLSEVLVLTLFFLMSPIISEAALGFKVYLFQNDIISLPLVMAIWFLYLKSSKWISLPVILFILTKEENILWFLVFYLVLVILESRKKELEKYIFWPFLFASLVSVISLWYFKNHTDLVFVSLQLNFAQLVSVNYLTLLGKKFICFLPLLLFFLPYFFSKNKEKLKIFIIVSLVIFVRLLIDVLLVMNVPMIHYWGNVVPYVIVFLVLLTIYKPSQSYSIYFSYFAIAFIILLHIILNTNLINGSKLFFQEQSSEENGELGMIAKNISFWGGEHFETIMLSGSVKFQRYFITSRSLIDSRWLVEKDEKLQDRFLKTVQMAVLDKTDKNFNFETLDKYKLCKTFETTTYLVYLKSATACINTK